MADQPASEKANDLGPAAQARRYEPRHTAPPDNTRFSFDVGLCGGGAVAGADEAGRGSLAGPLVAAAVCLDYDRLGQDDFAALAALDDSKKLSGLARSLLYGEILRRAQQVTIVCRSSRTIDREGLHRTNLAALAAALRAMAPCPDAVLVDGFALPSLALPHQAVVGGDGRSAAIAAASIVAKVTRDRLMISLHERHPQYGFDRHVGYATRAHHEAIVEHGVCELHRLSFDSVAYGQLRLGLSTEGPAG